MNIMLTEIRSLTLEMQDMPVVAPGGGDGFTGLPRQQLPADPENADQIIEFKEFFENFSSAAQTSELNPVGPAAAAWQDFLSQQQIHISTDADPVALTPVDIDTSLLDQPRAFAVAGAQIPIGTGEPLPVGGNLLPDAAIGGLAMPRAEIMPAALRPGSASAAINPASVAAEALVNPLAPAPTPAVATDSGGSVATAAASLTGNGIQSIVAESSSARLAGGQPSPDVQASLNATLAAENATRSEPDARLKIPAFETRATITRADGAGERMPNPVSLTDTRPDGLAVSANPVRESVSKELPLLRDLPLPRGLDAAVPIPLRQTGIVTAGVENVDYSDLAETFRLPAQAVKTHSEAAGPELGANRNLELAQQISSSQTQQSLTASSVSGHSHAISAAVTAPPVNQNALPAQLETMNLTRTSDAGELSNGLGERVNWMINQKQNSATIRLDPPMLGKLDVQIKIADDATTITIQTQHAQTRDLIESASVRLRDLLQESGYQNVNVDVSQRQDQQQSRSQTASDETSANGEELNPEQDKARAQQHPANYFTGDGLLDTFA